MPVELPPCPASLRAIQHHLKTAAEHDDRDPVVSYWCRLCALQTALKIDKKSDEAKVFLMGLMDWLEVSKKNMRENESVTNEVAAQAYIENYALKLFFWADGQDRAGIFNKNVVKAFYTAGMLMDVLCVFGELTDEVVANRKYAKWKAAYIHNCLKNGEMPVPGPMKDDGDENNTNIYVPSTSDNTSTPPPNIGFQFEPSGGPSLPDPPNTLNYGGNSSIVPPPLSMPGSASTSNDNSLSRFNISQPPSTPTPEPQDDSSNCKNLAKETDMSNDGYKMKKYTLIYTHSDIFTAFRENHKLSNMLDPEKITKAQKYCKWAISALNYDDVPEAVSNIKKALHLLQTGEES